MNDFKGKNIYVGLDLHKSSMDINILTEHTNHKSMHIKPVCPDILVDYLEEHFPGADYYCAYESGFSGFWLQRALAKRGVKTIVVHAADIPSTDWDKRFKSDKVDARKIAFCLRAGLLKGIHVPDQGQLLDRSIVRNRYKVVADSRRIKNRIKGHLMFLGIKIPWDEGVSERYWSYRMISNIEAYGESKKDQALLLMIEELKLFRKLEAKVLRAIRTMAKSAKYDQHYNNLTSIPGVGLITAMTILTEIGSEIKRFGSLDQLASYCGIVPGSHSSGESTKTNRICSRGNRYLKNVLVLSAWMSIRYDLKMLAFFETCRSRMIAQKAIIKVCRKQLNRIRYVLKNETKLIAK